LPIEFAGGVIVHFRDRPEGSYILRDASDTTVMEGRITQDGEARQITLLAPKTGTYTLELTGAAGWQLKTQPGAPIALLNEHGKKHSSLGQFQACYFYVPRGTKELQYFWGGNVHKVLGPDGNVLRQVAETDEIITIPVPPGADGKVWSFGPLGHSRLHFFNAPNIIAASPEALLVPQELVAKDGLTPK
jgi:hypothetical protein